MSKWAHGAIIKHALRPMALATFLVFCILSFVSVTGVVLWELRRQTWNSSMRAADNLVAAVAQVLHGAGGAGLRPSLEHPQGPVVVPGLIDLAQRLAASGRPADAGHGRGDDQPALEDRVEELDARPERCGFFRLGPPLGLLFSAMIAFLALYGLVPSPTVGDKPGVSG